jgi:hypothetical protein
MNCGGGSERSPLLRQHRHSMAIRSSASNGDGLVVVAHVVASSECWLLPSACRGFLPTTAQPDAIFFSQILKI